MQQYCGLLLAGLAAPVQVITGLISKFLDGESWWTRLSARLKLLYTTLGALVIGGACYGLSYAFKCPGTPSWETALYAVGNTVFAFLWNGWRHEVRVARKDRVTPVFTFRPPISKGR